MGTDAWDREQTLRASATAGANASGAIAGEWTRAGRTRCEHSVFARTEGNSRAAIAMEIRVWARTGATSGAGCRGAGARGCRRGARGYGGGGYKLTLPQLYFC
jgi:hypothetical protein